MGIDAKMIEFVRHTLYNNDDMMRYSDDLYDSDKYHNSLGMTVIAS